MKCTYKIKLKNKQEGQGSFNVLLISSIVFSGIHVL